MQAITATIASAKGEARDQLRIDFHGVGDSPNVSTTTDASGVFIVMLEPGEYLIPSNNAFSVNGQDFPAGTTFRLIVPEGEGPIDLTSSVVEIIDFSPPAMMARLDALQTALDALTSRVTALEIL